MYILICIQHINKSIYFLEKHKWKLQKQIYEYVNMLICNQNINKSI